MNISRKEKGGGAGLGERGKERRRGKEAEGRGTSGRLRVG